jgi:hypothetical protein
MPRDATKRLRGKIQDFFPIAPKRLFHGRIASPAWFVNDVPALTSRSLSCHDSTPRAVSVEIGPGERVIPIYDNRRTASELRLFIGE